MPYFSNPHLAANTESINFVLESSEDGTPCFATSTVPSTVSADVYVYDIVLH
ncbi:hypothetical protein H1R20_g12015, partial [Candolleomyces eurysporus]